jgi:hypothetical protein
MNRRTALARLLSLCLGVASVAGASPAGAAFFQKTTVEGTIGKDLGGVWLVVHQVMPMFRVRIDRGADRVAPFDVGPIGDEYAALFPGKPHGVVITKMADPTVSARIGVFEGDIVSKINTVPVVDIESYKKGLASVGENKWFLATIKRTGMRYTTAKLVKIEYAAKEGVLEDGTTGVAEENIQVQFLDTTLPFADRLEKTRESHEAFLPDENTIAALSNEWWKLPAPKQPVFVNGEHRLVVEANYDSALREDDNLDNTSFAIVSQFQGNPMAGGGGKNIAVYGARDVGAKKITGTYVETTMAQAPFPISIEFTGSFTMNRIADYSNKDSEYRLEQMKSEQKDLEQTDAPLAPDIPAVLPPKEAEPPKVAE